MDVSVQLHGWTALPLENENTWALRVGLDIVMLRLLLYEELYATDPFFRNHNFR
jgi:hypothetical protein